MNLDEDDDFGAVEARVAGDMILAYARGESTRFWDLFDHMIVEFECSRVVYALVCLAGSVIGEISAKVHPALLDEIEAMVEAIVEENPDEIRRMMNGGN